jgi:uncharacterized protein
MKRGTRRRPNARQAIDRMVRRIVHTFNPDRIILFGSRARGQSAPDSDVDLLVVMPFSGSRRAQRVAIRTALLDVGWPKDILLATPEETASAPGIPGSIVRTALEEGKVLYARAQ